MTLRIDDVERRDGRHTAREVVCGPAAAPIVVPTPTGGLVMIWRHRFMPDTRGWRYRAGQPDEEPESAARRECLEETFASAAEYVGEPTDSNEVAEVDWISLERAADALSSGTTSDAFTRLGVMLALARSGYRHLLAESAAPTSAEARRVHHTP